MKKLKILHILHAAGGVEVYLRLLLKHINPDKFCHVIVHGRNDTPTDFYDKNNRPVKAYRLHIQRDIRPFTDWSVYRELRPLIEKENPHLIHGHSAKGGVFSRLIGKQLGIPVLYTPHAYSFLSTGNPLKKNMYLRFERYFSNFNNKVLACSVSEKKRALHDVHYPAEKVEVFNNAIPPIDHLPNLQIKKTWPDQYICSVGRPSYQKNIALTLEVVKVLKQKMPHIHLVLLAGGLHTPNANHVKAQIKKHQLYKHVTLLEWANRPDVLNIVNQAKLYLSTARYEGLPYALIEAMALKKTAVVSDVDGNRDLVDNGKSGFVVNPNNPEAYAEKIFALLENAPLREKFEKQAFQKFQTHFNILNTINQLEALFCKAVKTL